MGVAARAAPCFVAEKLNFMADELGLRRFQRAVVLVDTVVAPVGRETVLALDPSPNLDIDIRLLASGPMLYCCRIIRRTPSVVWQVL